MAHGGHLARARVGACLNNIAVVLKIKSKAARSHRVRMRVDLGRFGKRWLRTRARAGDLSKIMANRICLEGRFARHASTPFGADGGPRPTSSDSRAPQS